MEFYQNKRTFDFCLTFSLITHVMIKLYVKVLQCDIYMNFKIGYSFSLFYIY